jgi:hypothetical protein
MFLLDRGGRHGGLADVGFLPAGDGVVLLCVGRRVQLRDLGGQLLWERRGRRVHGEHLPVRADTARRDELLELKVRRRRIYAARSRSTLDARFGSRPSSSGRPRARSCTSSSLHRAEACGDGLELTPEARLTAAACHRSLPVVPTQ